MKISPAEAISSFSSRCHLSTYFLRSFNEFQQAPQTRRYSSTAHCNAHGVDAPWNQFHYIATCSTRSRGAQAHRLWPEIVSKLHESLRSKFLFHQRQPVPRQPDAHDGINIQPTKCFLPFGRRDALGVLQNSFTTTTHTTPQRLQRYCACAVSGDVFPSTSKLPQTSALVSNRLRKQRTGDPNTGGGTPNSMSALAQHAPAQLHLSPVSRLLKLASDRKVCEDF